MKKAYINAELCFVNVKQDIITSSGNFYTGESKDDTLGFYDDETVNAGL